MINIYSNINKFSSAITDVKQYISGEISAGAIIKVEPNTEITTVDENPIARYAYFADIYNSYKVDGKEYEVPNLNSKWYKLYKVLWNPYRRICDCNCDSLLFVPKIIVLFMLPIAWLGIAVLGAPLACGIMLSGNSFLRHRDEFE